MRSILLALALAAVPVASGAQALFDAVRTGDHQAVVDMVVVKVKGSDFATVGKVPGTEAVGPDKCERF